MFRLKNIAMVVLALALAVGGMGITARPAQASGCAYYHTVYWGQSLSWIGRYYGVNWLSIAAANGIPRPYTVYAGQRLCIPGGGYPYNYNYINYTPSVGAQRTWSFGVTSVVQNATVTIQSYNFPSNVWFKVRIGRYSGGSYDWQNLPDLDTGDGGSASYTFSIPAGFSGAGQLVLRLVQTKKNGRSFSQDQVFYNVTGSGGTGGQPVPPGPFFPPYYYGTIPTIWIASVVQNSTVTIVTRNFPAGLNFDVYMGPMGTRGVGGYYVGTLYSGSGGSLTQTFSIPPALYGSYQIAIRTQNWPTGYYSYNWFYNNTAY